MTTAYVATIGGHISELVELAERMPERGDELWITSDSPQTRDLLAGRNVEFVPFIGERDHRGILEAIPRAKRLYKHYGVDKVISTGSAIALAYLPLAAALGHDVHYIESSTRVETCSVTGRVLSKLPRINCWWQFDPAPKGFRAIPGVYDHYASIPRSAELATSVGVPENGSIDTLLPDAVESDTAPIKNVVVTVGTTDRDFRRLILKLLSVIPSDAEVLWQTGASVVHDLGIDAHRLIPESELIEAINDADVVVTHAGAGSLALTLQAGKVPVFVPRRASFDEQIDDHQVELARWADGKGLAVMAEADRIELAHLERAARLQTVTKPVGELVLT